MEEKAYFVLYGELREDFLGWSMKRFGLSLEESRDIYQDTFLRFWNNMRSGKIVEFTCEPKTYVFSIGKHLILDFIAKKNRHAAASQLYLPDSVEDRQQSEEDSQHTVYLVRGALSKLEDKERRLIELYYFEQKDMRTIADLLGYKNADVAKKRKYEVFRKLCGMVKPSMKMNQTA